MVWVGMVGVWVGFGRVWLGCGWVWLSFTLLIRACLDSLGALRRNRLMNR